jgi:hypothetical protein
MKGTVRIAPDRHEREAEALLGGDFEGIVGSDRWWTYRGFAPKRRQACWSHYADTCVMPTLPRKPASQAEIAVVGSA